MGEMVLFWFWWHGSGWKDGRRSTLLYGWGKLHVCSGKESNAIMQLKMG